MMPRGSSRKATGTSEIHGHPITFRLTYTCHCGCGGFMTLTAEQPSLPSSHMWIHLATVRTFYCALIEQGFIVW